MPTKVPHDAEQRQLQQLEYEIQYHETFENVKETPHPPPIPSTEPKLPKKRGPKKKQMTPSRVALSNNEKTKGHVRVLPAMNKSTISR